MDTQILIAGGGPVGLMVALELNKQGVNAILIEKNLTTTKHPKMDITNGRSMELFRRWGVAKKLRDVAVSQDHGFSVIWASNVAGHELARFDYPTPNEYRSTAKAVNDGSRTLEPAMRVSQILIEPCLKDHLESDCPNIDVRFGWKLKSFAQDEEGVTATIKHYKSGEVQLIRSLYLAGCEGAGSICRKQLNIGYDEVDVFGLIKKVNIFSLLGHALREKSRGQSQPDGRVYMIHFTSPELDFFERYGHAWHIQSPNGSTVISQNDKDAWTMHVPLGKGEDVSKIDPKQKLFEMIGKEFECTVNIANAWTPRLSVIDKFGEGRVWMAGDAVRQVTPAGGYGMNTGVGDAMAIGWTLAAVLQGWGTPRLLDAYEAERRPVAIINRDALGEHVLVRLKVNIAMRNAMYDHNTKGGKVRKKIGETVLNLGNLENEAIGIEAGYRYNNSPAICYEDADSPPDVEWDKINPNTSPGSRVPSIWLEDGRAIQDLLSDQFTLIRFSDIDITALREVAEKRKIPLAILDIRDTHAAEIYEKNLVLVRPDLHVAWRGDKAPNNGEEILNKVLGY